jgi:hypothetical protein
MVEVNEESGLLGGGGEGEDEGGEEAERYAAGHEEQGTTCGVQGPDPTSGNRGQTWDTRCWDGWKHPSPKTAEMWGTRRY